MAICLEAFVLTFWQRVIALKLLPLQQAKKSSRSDNRCHPWTRICAMIAVIWGRMLGAYVRAHAHLSGARLRYRCLLRCLTKELSALFSCSLSSPAPLLSCLQQAPQPTYWFLLCIVVLKAFLNRALPARFSLLVQDTCLCQNRTEILIICQLPDRKQRSLRRSVAA